MSIITLIATIAVSTRILFTNPTKLSGAVATRNFILLENVCAQIVSKSNRKNSDALRKNSRCQYK